MVLGRNLFAVLKCYLDDSGTHDKSQVIVWGGVFGHEAFFGQFEGAWTARLQEPCEGKPPIKMFHSFDLARGENEFASYNVAERDRARFLFRKVIVDAGLTWLSVGVSVGDWRKYAMSRAINRHLKKIEKTITSLRSRPRKKRRNRRTARAHR